MGGQRLAAGGQSPGALLLPPQWTAFTGEGVLPSLPLSIPHKAFSTEATGAAPPTAPRELVPVSGLA